jgi:carboxymethylenebutenolidase
MLEQDMLEQDVQMPAGDGMTDAVIIAPGREGRWPGVLMLTDIGGIREAPRQMARRLAGGGYTIVMPNLFYRTARPPLFPSKVDFADPRTHARFGELREPLTPEAIDRDAVAYVDFTMRQERVAAGPLAIIGYCASGAIAIRIAAMRPDAIGALASFHGGRLATDAPTSPHLLLPRIKARLYFGHASNDNSMPPAAIDTLQQALAAWGGTYESETYEGAAHGWTVPDHPAYNPTQAERAFGKLTDLLRGTFGQQSSHGHAR